MKKLISVLLALTFVLVLTSCKTTEGNGEENTPDVTNPVADALLSDGDLNTGMKEKFDQMEYAAYVDLFYNDNGSSYAGKTYKKGGTFAILKDAYSDVTRYYVWGYADNTKCCDYQWELSLPEGAEIPEPGSYIKVEGTMEQNDKALDGYWLKDCTITVVERFNNAGFDMDLTTMSSTLVRVQIINILQHKEKFENTYLRVFGRALSANTIQHPYYNESWTMHFSETDTTPATGKYILLEGNFNADGTSNTLSTTKLTVIG